MTKAQKCFFVFFKYITQQDFNSQKSNIFPFGSLFEIILVALVKLVLQGTGTL